MRSPLPLRSLAALLPGCLILVAAAVAWFQPPRSVPATLDEIRASFPSETLVFDADGELLGALPAGRRGVWLDEADLPPAWRAAFTEHLRNGPRPGRLLVHALGGRPPGAGSPWARVVDAREGAALERALGRDGTLEALSNTFAVPGAGGVGLDLAARHVFGQRGTDLDRPQATALARLLTSPAPRSGPAPTAGPSPAPSAGQGPEVPSPVLALVAEELREGALGATLAARGISDPTGAGLQVFTTLDPALQETAEELLPQTTRTSPGDGRPGSRIAIVRDGAVLAFAGPPDVPEGPLAAPPPEVARLALHGLALERGWSAGMLLDADATTVPFEPTAWIASGAGRDTVSLSDALLTGSDAAAAWLLLHLYDHEDPDALLALADEVGLLPSPEETPRAYHRRLRRRSVRPTVDAERETLAALALQDSPADRPSGPASAALVERLDGWQASWEHIRQASRERSLGDVDLVGWWCRDEPRDASFGEGGPGWLPMTAAWLAETRTGPLGRQRPLRTVFGPHAALLDGRVPVSAVTDVLPSPSRLPAGPRRWDPANLVFDPTFRVALALEELASLMETAGAGAPLARTPDLVRGGHGVSLLGAASVAEAVLTGAAWGERPRLIREVRTRDGQLIWRARPTPQPLLGRAPGALASALRSDSDLAVPGVPSSDDRPELGLRLVGPEDPVVIAAQGHDIPAALLDELAERVRPTSQPGPTSLATPTPASSPSRARALPR